jgi:hypothetical protein
VELRQQRLPRLTRLVALAAACAAAVMLLLALASPAGAQSKLKQPPDFYKPPSGYALTGAKVLKIADRTEAVQSQRKLRGQNNLYAVVYTNGKGRWQVSYFQGRKERAQVQVADATGAVIEQWRGIQVGWRMARGYEGQFGRKLNAWYVFIPLSVAFLLPFVDPRRPFRLLHLDLLVLLSFAVSHTYYNNADIYVSTPLFYPPMLYLLARMLWVGFRPREKVARLVPWMPMIALGLALVFLVGFRVALNVTDARVIDVGYASVVGADRIADGEDIYGEGEFPKDVGSGDTYGPVNYLAYVPWEQVMPWSGKWDQLPSAHGAALTFDLLTLLGLFVLGRRLRAGPAGTWLGMALAYAWAAYPYTLFVLQSNSNDSIVAMFVVWALVLLKSTPGRGLMIGLATAAKFTPIVLAPLFAMASPEKRWRNAVICSVVILGTIVVSFLPFIPDGGLREVYDRTLGYQAGRQSPFSIWGQKPGLDWLHTGVKAFAALLALGVAFFPKRKSPMQVAALGAAVMIAMELTAAHWFYLYIVWFAPMVFVALFMSLREAEEPDEPGEEPGTDELSETPPPNGVVVQTPA